MLDHKTNQSLPFTGLHNVKVIRSSQKTISIPEGIKLKIKNYFSLNSLKNPLPQKVKPYTVGRYWKRFLVFVVISPITH